MTGVPDTNSVDTSSMQPLPGGPDGPPGEAIRAVPVKHYWRWVGAIVALILAAAVVRLFILSPNIDWGAVGDFLTTQRILAGLRLTIIYTILSMALAIVLAVLMAVMRMSVNPVLSTISWVYIWLFRGTPALLQILFWFNIGLIIPKVWIGIPFTELFYEADTNRLITTSVAAVLALGVCEGAYLAEIVRAGIQSVDFGQTEASLALGMKRSLTFRRIILPQAMRAIIPPTGNEFIGMLKTTSLVSVIAARELMTEAQNIAAQNFLTIELLIVAASWYLFVTTIMTIGQFYVERYFARGSTNRDLPPTPIQRIRASFSRLFMPGGGSSPQDPLRRSPSPGGGS